ncbi:MAG: serine hydrolase domain-containing protein [Saprospiraceae bacterium]
MNTIKILKKHPIGVSQLAIAFLLLLSANQAFLSPPVSGKAHSSIEQQIDQAIKQFASENNVPGMTAAVSKTGRLVVNKACGYANYNDRKPMMPYHRSGIGSVSKIITSLGIMKLTEENPGFSVDQKLFGTNGVMNDNAFTAAYVLGSQQQNRPDWINWYNNMTVKHLMTHTAGLVKNDGETGPIRTYYGIKEDAKIPDDKLVQYHLIHKRLKFEPGSKAEYSNIGMGTFARMVVLAASGKSYGHYIDQKIFQPLGLQGDITNYDHTKDDFDSDRHVLEGGKIKTLKWPSDDNRGLDRVGAAGGWACSARSLIRLMVATDRLSNYKDILKPGTLDQMESRQFRGDKFPHGLGWIVDKDGKRVRHNGAGGGGKAELQKYFPGMISNGVDLGGINVAVCVNFGNIDLGKLKDFAQKLAEITARGSIPSSYDLFPESDPDNNPPKPGIIGSLVAGYKWGEGWSQAEFFKRGEQTYLMLLKEKGFTSKGNNVHINKVNSNGTIGDLVANYKWGEGWSQAQFFNRGEQTYLMLLKEKGIPARAKMCTSIG